MADDKDLFNFDDDPDFIVDFDTDSSASESEKPSESSPERPRKSDGSREPSRSSGSVRSRSHKNSKKKKKKKGKRGKKKNGFQPNLHLIFLGIAVLLIVFAIVRIVIWNMGEDSSYDPTADTSQYDTEPLDYIQPLLPEQLEGHEDDGETSILVFGNSPFSDNQGSDGLAQLISDQTGATVYDAAFPGSYVSMKNSEYQETYPQDALSLYMVAASFCNQNFDLLDHAVNNTSAGSEEASTSLAALKAADPEKIDMLVIMYDISDYIDERPLYDDNNDKSLITYQGALNAALSLVQETYPYIRIVVLTNTYGDFTDESGNLVVGGTTDLGNGTLVDYLLREVDAAMANGVTVIDNYYGTVNEDQKDEYLTDGYHLNQAGRERVAQRFVQTLGLQKE